jgi:hypothetical protein
MILARQGEDDAGISGAQGHDQLKRSFFDEIVDDPPLDLQWCDFEQKRDDRQYHQRELGAASSLQKRSEKWRSATGIRWAASIAFRQGRSNEVDQMAGRKGLFEYAGYAQAGGPLPRLRVKPARNQDRRHPSSVFLQTVDNVEAIHAGHVLVDHQTAYGATPVIGKEIGSRIIGLHIVAEGLEQRLQ